MRKPIFDLMTMLPQRQLAFERVYEGYVTPLFLILLLALFPLESANPPKPKLPVSSSDYTKCLKFTQSGPNLSAYSFYNGCGVDLFITACAKGSFGKTQLFQSARTIPINGRFTIYPFFDIDVRTITWSADPYQLPPVPALCAVPAKKK